MDQPLVTHEHDRRCHSIASYGAVVTPLTVQSPQDFWSVSCHDKKSNALEGYHNTQDYSELYKMSSLLPSMRKRWPRKPLLYGISTVLVMPLRTLYGLWTGSCSWCRAVPLQHGQRLVVVAN
ncbi:hypothetical protein BDA96_01G268000 [Sorghum bicolor]|uniref:Uncharacterized protein n=2 Tax=Sorghum bicolor TaxID=4558 RepID=A0A921S012_SORBI|nr:hypothetical protein BDA96_01G268000 [Sorghum bicolor]OQU91821.1 hypothetical protein SORBI_3001G253050 [Sorghum bicolor]